MSLFALRVLGLIEWSSGRLEAKAGSAAGSPLFEIVGAGSDS